MINQAGFSFLEDAHILVHACFCSAGFSNAKLDDIQEFLADLKTLWTHFIMTSTLLYMMRAVETRHYEFSNVLTWFVCEILF